MGLLDDEESRRKLMIDADGYRHRGLIDDAQQMSVGATAQTQLPAINVPPDKSGFSKTIGAIGTGLKYALPAFGMIYDQAKRGADDRAEVARMNEGAKQVDGGYEALKTRSTPWVVTSPRSSARRPHDLSDQSGHMADAGRAMRHALQAMWAIVARELAKFMRQTGRLVSALVRPLLWLAVFAAGFRNVFGVAIAPPYETYISYDVYIAPGRRRGGVASGRVPREAVPSSCSG